MRIESLYPRRTEAAPLGDYATTPEVTNHATATYGAQARDLLDRARGDAIAAISLTLLANDQKTIQASQPSVSEQALAQTVREQRERIDELENQHRQAVDDLMVENARGAQCESETERADALTTLLRVITADGGVRHPLVYTSELRALPTGSVVRDDRGRAWTRVADDDNGVWATPSEDLTETSHSLPEGGSLTLAWVHVA